MNGTHKEEMIDLRSDTVTKPTDEMRKAMMEAEVGDDVFGDDPTVNKLQQLAANKFGKEDALFVPSGTMGNLLAVLTHCRRGEEVVMGDQCHINLNEQGGCSSLGGIFPRTLPTMPDGTIPVNIIKDAIRGSDIHNPVSRVVALENTHNYCGGRVLKTEYVDSVGEIVKTYSQTHPLYKHEPLVLHMDGARIFNASVALGEPVSHMCRSLDSISVCLSKGLGSLVGSLLIGSQKTIAQARRWRKAVGGGMRQAGVLAACGILSLTTMVDRLSEDHDNAKTLVENIKDIKQINVLPVETNIVFIEIKDEFYDGDKLNSSVLVQKMKAKGALIVGTSPRKIRIVTHIHITKKDITKVAKYLHEVFDEL